MVVNCFFHSREGLVGFPRGVEGAEQLTVHDPSWVSHTLDLPRRPLGAWGAQVTSQTAPGRSNCSLQELLRCTSVRGTCLCTWRCQVLSWAVPSIICSPPCHTVPPAGENETLVPVTLREGHCSNTLARRPPSLQHLRIKWGH